MAAISHQPPSLLFTSWLSTELNWIDNWAHTRTSYLTSPHSTELLTTDCRVKSQSYFTTGGLPPVSSSWRQAPWDSRHSNFFFQLNTWGYSPYVTPSLTRGWVCRLKLLLVLASAVILGSESRGSHDHILLFQIRDLEGHVPVFISPRDRMARV
jgi:hypothetical protein